MVNEVWRGRIVRFPAVWAVILIASSLGCRGEGDGRSQTQGIQEEQTASFRDISVEELRGLMAEGDPFLVNVHVPFEGDLPGTDASIRFDEIADHLDRLPADRSRSIVLYCRSGRMSAEAAGVLADLGYTDVSNLEGGFVAWGEAGYEILR
jgi:rhodanese-related sulfurtransferase